MFFRLNKQKGEALILHDRCYPFISELPDIDEYECFKGYFAVKLEKINLSQPKALDLRLFELRCRMLARPYPFSASVTTEYKNFNGDDVKLTNMLIDMILNRNIKQETVLLNELKKYAENHSRVINFDNL